MIEIKIVGRGGQGGKTAAAILAKVALSTGKYIQSFPEYGAERQGAPVYAYTRISDSPIRIHSGVTNPNIVAVMDPTLLKLPITQGMPDDGVLIVNTTKSSDDVRVETGYKKGKVYTVDATGISIASFGKNIPNTPMLGAINAAADLFDHKLLETELIAKFGRKLNQDLLNKNIDAINKARQAIKNG